MVIGLTVILLILCGYNIIINAFSHDKASVWKPMTFVSLVYIYYCVIPVFVKHERFGLDNEGPAVMQMQIASVITYLCIWIASRSKIKYDFYSWNKLITEKNAYKAGIILFLIALLCYTSVRGFSLSFFAENDASRQISSNNFQWFLFETVDFFCIASGLLFVGHKKLTKRWVAFLPLWIIFVVFLVIGARWRIVAGALCIFPVLYMYPKLRRVNYMAMIILAVFMYLFFAFMDGARVRGVGIDMDRVQEYSIAEASKGASENYSVYWFSALTIDHCIKTGDYIYLEPIWNAICMPLPRKFFQWKPNAEYIRKMEMIADDAGGGAAYLYFAEAFASFGWFGIIVYSLLFGYLCAIFWNNYLRNRLSLGAIISLGLFNGFLYCFISRGYMASSLTLFFTLIIIPFWLLKYILRNNKS